MLEAIDLLVLLATVEVGLRAVDLRLAEIVTSPVISLIFWGSVSSILGVVEAIFSEALLTICRAKRISRKDKRSTKGSISTEILVNDDFLLCDRLSMDIWIVKSSRILSRLVSNLSIRQRNMPTLVICKVEAFCCDTSTCLVPRTMASELDMVGLAIKMTCASTTLTRKDMLMELSSEALACGSFPTEASSLSLEFSVLLSVSSRSALSSSSSATGANSSDAKAVLAKACKANK